MYFGGKKKVPTSLSKFRFYTLPSSCNFNEGFGTGAKLAPPQIPLCQVQGSPGSSRSPEPTGDALQGPGCWGGCWMGSHHLAEELEVTRAILREVCSNPGGVGREGCKDKPPRCDRSKRFQGWHQQSLVSALNPSPRFCFLPADLLLSQMPAGHRQFASSGGSGPLMY